MKLVRPVTYQESMLISTTATNAEADWSSGTTYALGAVVTYNTKRYESVQAANTNRQPDISPTWWLDLGADNKHAMFDNIVSTATTATTSFTVVIAPGVTFDTIALINTDAAVVEVSITDGDGGPVIYESTAGLAGTESFSWSDYFFNDPLLTRTQIIFYGIPQYLNARITITFTSSEGTEVGCGFATFGTLYELGGTQYGASAGIVDYSRKDTDEFGTITLVRRTYSKRLSADIYVKNPDLNRVQSLLYSLRATPSVWIASEDPTYEEALVIYGYYRDFSTTIAYPNHSMMQLEIEGLT